MIPNGYLYTTQLVVPLNSHPLIFLCFLAIIFMVIFSGIFQSSAVFGKLGGVSKKDKFQSRFSNSNLMV
jgi:hypothetical protein